MYVKNYMATNLITITEDTKILEALDLMEKNDLHRLPVMREGKLVGLVTEGTIQENAPSKASSLSIYELNYLLTKTAVKDIMIKKMIVIAPDALLEEAAACMRQHNIKCLPVIDQGELVGIVSQNDIFDAFIQMTGYYNEGSRVVVAIENDHSGILAEITAILAKNQLSINQIAVYRTDGMANVIIQLTSSDDQLIKDILKQQGYQVVSIKKNETK